MAGKLPVTREANDERVVLKRFYILFLDTDIDIIFVLDYHQVLISLSTRRKSFDLSAQSGMNYIHN